MIIRHEKRFINRKQTKDKDFGCDILLFVILVSMNRWLYSFPFFSLYSSSSNMLCLLLILYYFNTSSAVISTAAAADAFISFFFLRICMPGPN
jgi:hypothetical protein